MEECRKMDGKKQKSQETVLTVITKMCKKVNAFSCRLDAVSGKMPEIAAIVLYGILHCIVSFQHEASFDEAHAWNIARDATLYSTMFEVPHCEGHPSLWHLILMPFAKAGMDYTLSMLLITLFFTIVAVYLLEFRSKFPRIIKLILPFTYFFFYQYGVIARPYCMMLTAFMLLATLYGTRDEKPGRFTVALIFLCATSAFGTVFAGGIAIVWTCKIINGYRKKSDFTACVKDRRLICLMLLLIYAVFLLVRAVPGDNAYGAMNYNGQRLNGIGIRLLYLLTAIVSDLFFTTSYTRDFLADYQFGTYELTAACILGTAIIILIVFIGKKYRTLAEFIIPYALFGVFSTAIYFCIHNSGLLMLLITYWAWVTFETASVKNEAEEKNENRKFDIDECMVTLCLIGMIFPLIWSISSSIIDFDSPYTIGRCEAEYLVDNNLDKYDVCVEWQSLINPEMADSLEGYDLKHNIDMDRLAVYIEDIDFINWPLDYSVFPFYHTTTTDVENEAIRCSLREHPLPSVLIGEPEIIMLNDAEQNLKIDNKELIAEKYTEVFRTRTVKPWKGLKSFESSVIYVRKDILE